MKPLTEEKLAKAAAGDLATLVKLDGQGLLLGPDESLADYTERLRALEKNIRELQAELAKHGDYDFHGIPLIKADMIPATVFRSCRETTRRLFGFGLDWVPGFFTDKRMGLLFAGCSLYSLKDFFAVFIIRKAFQKKEKWWIYSRTELMAHELTHVAHTAFQTPNFEEQFAFQTGQSAFRRVLGGMFRTPKDTYLVLGAMFGILVAQIVNIILRPPERVWTMPMPLIFLAGFAAVFWVLGRYLVNRRRFKRALNCLATVFGEQHSLPVLFRCSEPEMLALAKLPHDDLPAWLARKQETAIRWQIIHARFAT